MGMLNFNHNIKNYDDNHPSLIQFMSDRPVYWLVLTTYCAYANTRGRAWPSMQTISNQATKGNQNIAIEAKKWLIEHQAMVLVPVDKRIGLEKKLDTRKHVYQLTGYVISDEGHIYEYTWMNDTDWEEIREALKDLNIETVDEKINKTTSPKISSDAAANLKEKSINENFTEEDRKLRSDAIRERITAKKKTGDSNSPKSGGFAEYIDNINKAIEWEQEFEKNLPEIIDNIKNKPSSPDMPEFPESVLNSDAISDYGEDSYQESSVEEFDKIEGSGGKDVKNSILTVRNFIMENWKDLSTAYGIATKMAKQMLGVSPKKDGVYYEYRFALPVTIEELQEFLKWWNRNKIDEQSEKPLRLPQKPDMIESNFSEFRNYILEKNKQKEPKKYIDIDMSGWA